MQETFMREAISLAGENVRIGRGGPFAAVIVKDGHVIARGVNQVVPANDPTAHAEIVAIREACRALRHYQLTDCDLYATCEPCPMCLGAIYWARPARVFFALTRADAAAIGFDDALIYEEVARPAHLRRIPMSLYLREEALTVFEQWERKIDRVPY